MCENCDKASLEYEKKIEPLMEKYLKVLFNCKNKKEV